MTRLAALVAALLLAGCARGDGAYPSLAPRAAEARDFTEPAVTPAGPVAADPTLEAKLGEDGTRLDAIVKGYDADLVRAEKTAGAAGARAVGSEAWVAAQAALAALDDWRAQAGGLATELDDLARERAATGALPYPALEALRARTEAESTREAAGIAATGAKLPSP